MTEARLPPARPRTSRRRRFAFVVLYLSALMLVTAPASSMRAGLYQGRHDARLRDDPQYRQYVQDMGPFGGAPDVKSAQFYRGATLGGP